jgi:xylan 1,4-beta-xylosidase
MNMAFFLLITLPFMFRASEQAGPALTAGVLHMTNNYRAVLLTSVLGLIFCLSACQPAVDTAANPTTAPAPAAQFNWFEYQGLDPLFAEPLPQGTYQNPVLAGFFPDPSITRNGDDYYMTVSSFTYTPGLPILHSRDLVNWQLTGVTRYFRPYAALS